jgi:hypothetical protein
MIARVLPLTPHGYAPHLLHTQDRNWAETNCYVDVWIELLHAWGYEPLAALPFTVGIDFEGDQFTFFKFPHADLRELYGLNVQELAIWRPLVAHVEEQVALGRPVLVELDSYYLPDTLGTAYRQQHVKSTVAAVDIDTAAQRLGYFHGQGYYELDGDDFVNVFRLYGTDDRFLPPYVEFVKQRPRPPHDEKELVQQSFRLLARYVAELPEENPFEKFKPRFEENLDWLIEAPQDMFHQYSFATLRQVGACYELTATYLQWLENHAIAGLAASRDGFRSLSTAAKTTQFQLARAMARKKRLDLTVIDDMAASWDVATTSLQSRLL